MHVFFDELTEYRNTLIGDITKAVSDASFLVYAVHPGMRIPTVLDLLNKYPVAELRCFETSDEAVTVLLGTGASPDLLVVEGKDEQAGVAEMTRAFGCRVYSIGFDVRGLDGVIDTLRARGVEFITETPVDCSGTRFISTTQSPNTGDTFWYVERKRGNKDYLIFPNARPVDIDAESAAAFKKQARLKTFTYMEGFDHLLYRVGHHAFMQAAMEVLAATPYTNIDITDLDENDARLMTFRRGRKQPALAMLCARSEHGAAEEYVRAHGPRIQHLSWSVSDVAKVFALQKKRGLVFAGNALQGDEDDGIRQIYTIPSPCTGDITEYVQRSGSEHALFPKHRVSGLFQDMPFA